MNAIRLVLVLWWTFYERNMNDKWLPEPLTIMEMNMISFSTLNLFINKFYLIFGTITPKPLPNAMRPSTYPDSHSPRTSSNL